MLPVQKQTPPTQAAESHPMSGHLQTPPTQAAKAHTLARENLEDLAESKWSPSKSSASLLDDGGSSAEAPQEDLFIFSMANFTELWDVCASYDFKEQPDLQVKESATRTMESLGDSGSQVSNVRLYHWAPQASVPGMMQTIGLVPVPENNYLGKSALPVSQGHPDRVLGLPIVVLDNVVRDQRPCYFRSKFLCQINPLMLPVMEVLNGALRSDDEWKLRHLLANRKEKLRVLILLFRQDVKTVLTLLGRFADLLSDVTTVVIREAIMCYSVYVIDLTNSKSRLDTIAMLVKSLTFEHRNEASFVKTMSACTAQNKSWHVVEATVEFLRYHHKIVSTYSKFPNIYFGSLSNSSNNRQLKNELSFLFYSSGSPIDLSDFQNLRSLDCHARFVSSPLQQSRALRHLIWSPWELTWFNECAWGCLPNLQFLTIHGEYLHPSSRILLECFPKLVSLHLNDIAESIVVDFGHLPLRLNLLRLGNFQGSLKGSDHMWIERLFFVGSVCSAAYSRLCPISDKVAIMVSDIGHAHGQWSLVVDQLKCLKVIFGGVGQLASRSLKFNTQGKVFSFLESLELVGCSVILSVVAFPRLHHLSLDRCDVCFPKNGVVGRYGDSFPELVSLAVTNCKLLPEGAVYEKKGQNPVGGIHLQADSLLSLKLIDVSNLQMLPVHTHSFPRLQSLQCHVAKDDDFPFLFTESKIPFFPHLRNLSLKRNAVDDKVINLDLLADMSKLERLELLGNAFLMLDGLKPIECRWVHFSSNVVKHEVARRFVGGTSCPMELSADMMTFAISFISEKCEKLIIDQHIVCLPDRNLAESSSISLPMLPVQKQTPPTPAASSHSVTTQIQIPPTQAARSHPIASMSNDDLAESKSSPSRLAASSLDDGGPSAETPQDDMFIFINTTFQHLPDVCDGFNVQEQPEVELKEPASAKVKNFGDSETPGSGFRSYRWAPCTPIPGIMQTIVQVPVPEEGCLGESALPFSQGHVVRVLALPIVAWNCSEEYGRPYFFRSKFLCQLNPLMLPVMEVPYYGFPSDEEWKLRDLLANRKEKLRVLILSFHQNEKTALTLLGRFADLLSDVTTVVLGDARFSKTVYVIDLTLSKDRVTRIATLVNNFAFKHDDNESFVKTMSACTAQHKSWHVVEATVGFNSSLHKLVSTYTKSPNIYFGSLSYFSNNRQLKNELSFLYYSSGSPIDLSDFQNLRSLSYHDRFVNSPLQQSRVLRHLIWSPRELTWFNECAWGCLPNLQLLTIDGEYLHPSSRISLDCFPKLVSLHLYDIAESIVVDFGHLPLRLNYLRLGNFQGSLEGSDHLRIERLIFPTHAHSDAYLQLCPISERVEVTVFKINYACVRLSLVADQLKCLTLFVKLSWPNERSFFPFSTLSKVFPLLESLELVRCSVTLSAVTFPRLRYLSLRDCDVSFPKGGISGKYGDSFPGLFYLAIANCKLLPEGAVYEKKDQNPVGGIHFQADSLLSLKLIDVSNLQMLPVHTHSFPRLQNLQCHLAKDDDFPFLFNESKIPFFPHLRNLSLKRNAMDDKVINLDLLADVARLEKLELLENAFFSLNNVKPIQCRWVHFSSAVVKHENARHRFPGWMPFPMESSAEMVAFAISLVSERCEKLVIDEHVVCLSENEVNMSEWYPLLFGIQDFSIKPAENETMMKKI